MANPELCTCVFVIAFHSCGSDMCLADEILFNLAEIGVSRLTLETETANTFPVFFSSGAQGIRPSPGKGRPLSSVVFFAVASRKHAAQKSGPRSAFLWAPDCVVIINSVQIEYKITMCDHPLGRKPAQSLGS